MTQRRWPFAYVAPEDDPGVNISQWSMMARNWGGDGVIGNAGGVVAETYADATGMHVKVKPGVAQLRGHIWESDATETVTIPANASGSPRVDLVVLRLDPTNDPDFITIEVVTGTPAAVAVEPTETRTYSGIFEIPLAAVRVDPGAVSIVAGKVSERRTFQPGRFECGETLWWPGLLEKRPAGFLPFSNTPVSRNTYHNLFQRLGTAWGAGDGATTFNIPPPGFVPAGVDPTVPEFNALGKRFGATKHKLSTGEMPSHTHIQNPHDHSPSAGLGFWVASEGTNNIASGSSTRRSTLQKTADTTATNQSTGGSGFHNNTQPTMSGYWLLKT